MNVLAGSVEVGDRIVLDMGYGAHSSDEVCQVLEVDRSPGLFGNDAVRFTCRLRTGERFNTCDFDPANNITKEVP